MSSYMLNISTRKTIKRKRSSSFRPSLEDEEILKKGISSFIESHRDKVASITWQRLSPGYRIVDFEINRVAESIDFLKGNYFCSNHSCASTSLYIDRSTAKTYQQYILDVISDRNSFCALEEGTGKLIGVALASVNSAFDSMDEDMDFTQISDIFDVIKFEKALRYEADIYDRYNEEKYFCIHAICVSLDAYNKGIGSALVRSCLAKAQKTGYSVCIGIFPAGPCQTIAQRLGFEILVDLPWVNIRSSKNSRRLSYTNHTVVENSFVSCMGICLPVESEVNKVEAEIHDNLIVNS